MASRDLVKMLAWMGWVRMKPETVSNEVPGDPGGWSTECGGSSGARLTHHLTDGEPGASREMSSMRMGVAGALPSCPEGEPENSLLRHEYSMFWKEETPVSVELLLWSRHCPYPYCRLAHAFTAGWPMPLLQALPMPSLQAGTLSFTCFLSARSSGKLCYCDLSLLARPGGLWAPNC